MASLKWRSVPCATKELNLAVLSLGQSFRWTKLVISEESVWQGIVANRIWQLSASEGTLRYRVIGRFSRCQLSSDANDLAALRDYFHLDAVPNLDQLYAEWSLVDPYFSTIASITPGIRVLRQDPVECLFSFICSTNNNIKRISSMVNALCRLFGESVDVHPLDHQDNLKRQLDEQRCYDTGSVETEGDGVYADESSGVRKAKRRKVSNGTGTSHSCNEGRAKKSSHSRDNAPSNSCNKDEVVSAQKSILQPTPVGMTHTFYDFPTATRLAQADVEATLRDNGFGYRAKYVASTAKMLLEEYENEENIRKALNDLRTCSNLNEARQFLLKLQGVGPKVADCVCLMSLDKTDAVPIDTHVRRITAERYLPNLKTSSLTMKMYDEIGEFYRNLFGRYAGWAHSVLFSAQVGKK